MTEDEKETFWRNTQCIVEKDVVRTDRSHPYFKGEDNPNIEILKYEYSLQTSLPVKIDLKKIFPRYMICWFDCKFTRCYGRVAI